MVELFNRDRTENVGKKEKECTQEAISKQRNFLYSNRFIEDLTNEIWE
jgi:hypothetical protein